MFDDEDEILVSALGSLGATVGAAGGTTFAAKRLKKDVYETEFVLPLPFAAAVEYVSGQLAQSGRSVATPATHAVADARALRAIVGGGIGGLNPVLITVVLSAGDAEHTNLTVRGAAKEGLIKQRAGEKTGKRIAEALQLNALK